MIERVPNTFYGLPIPNDIEAQLLENTILGNDPKFEVNPTYLANGLILRNPGIKTVMEGDRLHWLEHSSSNLSEAESDEFSKYIDEGYRFIIGTIATLGYMRNRYSSSEQFWRESQDRGDIPRIGYQASKRVVDFISGSSNCPIDISYSGLSNNSIKLIRDSSEVAFMDSESYISKFKGLRNLIGRVIEDFPRTYYVNEYNDPKRPSTSGELVHKLRESRSLGFRHGVMGGIEMMIQSSEQDILRKIWPLRGLGN